MKWGIKQHVKNLKAMFNDDHIIIKNHCPNYKIIDKIYSHKKSVESYRYVCEVCLDFIGISMRLAGVECPCTYYGEAEAIRITKEKIEEFDRLVKII